MSVSHKPTSIKPPAEEINAMAIAELSVMQVSQKAESDQAVAELSILVAGLMGGVANV